MSGWIMEWETGFVGFFAESNIGLKVSYILVFFSKRSFDFFFWLISFYFLKLSLEIWSSPDLIYININVIY